MKNRLAGFRLLVAGAGAAFSLASNALSLSTYLEQVQKSHAVFEAVKLTQEAAELRQAQGDLELSPYLMAKASYFDDKKPQAMPAMQGTETLAKELSLGVAKKFATGTAVKVGYSEGYNNILGMSVIPGGFPPGWTGTLSLSVSQSLWKDFFGKATRLRHEREDAAARAERLGQELEARKILIEAESAYWDYVFGTEDSRIRHDSLERAQKILSWTKARVGNGLGDRADSLQAEALVGARELQWIGSQDDLKGSLKTLGDFLAQKHFEQTKIEDDFKATRDPRAFAQVKEGVEPVRLDALLARYTSQVKRGVAGEIDENLKPDLTLEGMVASNARDASLSTSLSNSLKSDTPTLAAGLTFKMDLDFGGKSSVRQMANADAKAAELRASRLQYESESAWSELLRRHGELSRRIQAAESLAKVQMEKSRREQERLRNGRTTTFQVINFEQDAAEAESTLLRLRIEQRKLEARARMFVAGEQ